MEEVQSVVLEGNGFVYEEASNKCKTSGEFFVSRISCQKRPALNDS